MTMKLKEGDTCGACSYNWPTIKICETCKQRLPNLPSMPYCHKNKFWIAEANPEGGPCLYFKRKQQIVFEMKGWKIKHDYYRDFR